MEVTYRFIGGYGRSGTTVLMNALGVHPSVLLFVETQVLPHAVFPYFEGKIDEEHLTLLYERFLYSHPRSSTKHSQKAMTHFKRVQQQALSFLTDKVAPKPERVARFLDLLLGEQVRMAQKSVCLEKTPNVIGVWKGIWDAIPSARFLHICRDPRDVWCSIRKHAWGPSDVSSFIESYTGLLGTALEQYEAMPKGTVLAVKMSDLAAHPHDCLKRAALFFGLSAQPEFLSRACSLVEMREAHVDRWRQDLDVEDAKKIVKECNDIYSRWCIIAEL